MAASIGNLTHPAAGLWQILRGATSHSRESTAPRHETIAAAPLGLRGRRMLLRGKTFFRHHIIVLAPRNARSMLTLVFAGGGRGNVPIVDQGRQIHVRL
jgi:hypothetical protein